MENNIENKLSFNQWQAFLLLKSNRDKAFEVYCKSCKFSEEEKQMIIDTFKNS
tara:strand:- start:976 stop:1134 length:159 start_codon:yes stop_codon:yes gene_type:complete